MLVTLPSGATAPLEVPGLPALLTAGGDLAALAACAFAHDEVEVEELYESDLFFVAAWALEQFAASDEGLELAIVADGWKRSPAQVIGLHDLLLAWAFERDLYLRLRAAASGASEDSEDGEPAEGGVHFTTEEVTL